MLLRLLPPSCYNPSELDEICTSVTYIHWAYKFLKSLPSTPSNLPFSLSRSSSFLGFQFAGKFSSPICHLSTAHSPTSETVYKSSRNLLWRGLEKNIREKIIPRNSSTSARGLRRISLPHERFIGKLVSRSVLESTRMLLLLCTLFRFQHTILIFLFHRCLIANAYLFVSNRYLLINFRVSTYYFTSIFDGQRQPPSSL